MENIDKQIVDVKDQRLKIEYLAKDSKKGFAMLAGINRPIVPGQVTKLAKSVENMGILRPVVVAVLNFITGKPVTYIIDGQHLYHACLRLNIEVPYTTIAIKDDLDMISKLALLNTSSKTWTIKDYIQVWGYKLHDYVELNKYLNIYDIELMQLAEILQDNTCSYKLGSIPASKHIKSGTFKINDRERAIFLINCITDALKIVPRMDRSSNKFFIASYVSFINTVSGYDHKRFLANLVKNKDKFVLSTQDAEEYKKLFKTLL